MKPLRDGTAIQQQQEVNSTPCMDNSEQDWKMSGPHLAKILSYLRATDQRLDGRLRQGVLHKSGTA